MDHLKLFSIIIKRKERHPFSLVLLVCIYRFPLRRMFRNRRIGIVSNNTEYIQRQTGDEEIRECQLVEVNKDTRHKCITELTIRVTGQVPEEVTL